MCWWGNHLFVIFAVLDVSLAVNLCIDFSFLTFFLFKYVDILKSYAKGLFFKNTVYIIKTEILFCKSPVSNKKSFSN